MRAGSITNTPFEAFCFDLDGVLTPTVEIQEAHISQALPAAA